MKNIRKKSVAIVFLLLVVSLGILKLNNANAEIDFDYFNFRIDDAYYGNFDSDRLNDDIRIIASISTDFEGAIISYMDIDIKLPSNFKYHFDVTVCANPDGNGVTFIITAYNTATESGWYYVEIDGLFFLNCQVIMQSGNILFDPPNEMPGEGDPDIGVTVIDWEYLETENCEC